MWAITAAVNRCSSPAERPINTWNEIQYEPSTDHIMFMWPIITHLRAVLMEWLNMWIRGISTDDPTVWVWVSYDPSSCFSCECLPAAANKPFWMAALMDPNQRLSKTCPHKIGVEHSDVIEGEISKMMLSGWECFFRKKSIPNWKLCIFSC